MAAEVLAWPRPAWWLKFKVGPGGCWIWTGYIHPSGYGRTNLKGESWVHRATYRILVGPIPEELETDHICRVKPCGNPSHLDIVTPTENMHRRHLADGGATHCEHGLALWGGLGCLDCAVSHSRRTLTSWGILA